MYQKIDLKKRFHPLNMPECQPALKKEKGKLLIFDPVSRQWRRLTPEEWVRQHVLVYLMEHKQVPRTRISVEKNQTSHSVKAKVRYDVSIWSNTHNAPLCLVECKAPYVELHEGNFSQTGLYFKPSSMVGLWLTNGIEHQFLIWDHATRGYIKHSHLPTYAAMEALQSER